MKTRGWLVGFALLVSGMLISCSSGGTGGSGEMPQRFDVYVTVTPEGAGTISPSADTTYEEGEEILLRAIPGEEYSFDGWAGDLEVSDNPLSLEVDGHFYLEAQFSPAD